MTKKVTNSWAVLAIFIGWIAALGLNIYWGLSANWRAFMYGAIAMWMVSRIELRRARS